MSVFISAVGAVESPNHSVASIERIQRDPGDGAPVYRNWTSGTLSRELQVEAFFRSQHEWLFLTDTDMEYPSDCLKRLLKVGKPVVSGLYLRRDPWDLLPAAWEEPPNVEDFPLMQLTDFPPDAVMPVGAVGHGYMLIHRQALSEIRDACAPEPIMLRAPMPDWSGDPSLHVGPDVRFCLFARRLGYKIWLDTGCRAKHWVQVALSVEDYERSPKRFQHDWYGKTALARIVRRSQKHLNNLDGRGK